MTTHYDLNTTLDFGRYNGYTLQYVIDAGEEYIHWAFTDIEGFSISKDAVLYLINNFKKTTRLASGDMLVELKKLRIGYNNSCSDLEIYTPYVEELLNEYDTVNRIATIDFSDEFYNDIKKWDKKGYEITVPGKTILNRLMHLHSEGWWMSVAELKDDSTCFLYVSIGFPVLLLCEFIREIKTLVDLSDKIFFIDNTNEDNHIFDLCDSDGHHHFNTLGVCSYEYLEQINDKEMCDLKVVMLLNRYIADLSVFDHGHRNQ